MTKRRKLIFQKKQLNELSATVMLSICSMDQCQQVLQDLRDNMHIIFTIHEMERR
jgi:uncharacterized coiled-coil protein SlyX